MADNNTIARPYAQAVFELAWDAKELERWSDALSTAREVLADGQVSRFLGRPTLTPGQKLMFLTELLKAAGDKTSILAGGSKEGTNFLKLLLEHGRVGVLPEIADHFDTLKANIENTVDVTITSAAPLSVALQKQIVEALKERLGRDINLETKIDEGLIGGAVIRAGDVVIDGSLQSRLESLANALIA